MAERFWGLAMGMTMAMLTQSHFQNFRRLYSKPLRINLVVVMIGEMGYGLARYACDFMHYDDPESLRRCCRQAAQNFQELASAAAW